MRSGPNPNRLAGAIAGKSCPICLNGIKFRSAAIIPCLHAYCIGCIRRWSDFKRNCPLCNADFTSWFCKSDSGNFGEEILSSPSDKGKNAISIPRNDVVLRRRRSEIIRRRSLYGRFRDSSIGRSQATSVLPRRRSFVAQRVQQWRASIYERRLQAVPLPSKNGLVQIVGNNGARELLLRKIEPWIQRELHAVLGDPDPTVILHVATSLFISQCEKRHENFRGQLGVEDDFLAPLRPFLQENTEIFWHELRCFAESSFSMETYDTVVEYKRMD